jgi:hypothetical protein
MEIEIKGFLSSLGASHSVLGVLLLAGALLLFRATSGESLRHIPLVEEDLEIKKKKKADYSPGERDVLAQGYKQVKTRLPFLQPQD